MHRIVCSYSGLHGLFVVPWGCLEDWYSDESGHFAAPDWRHFAAPDWRQGGLASQGQCCPSYFPLHFKEFMKVLVVLLLQFPLYFKEFTHDSGLLLFACLFVSEEIPITVSRQAPDKEAWPSPYH